MTISEVARQIGIHASTIRYYERIGILQPAMRMSGQRRYDNSVLYRLALVERAQRSGFTLDEIRQLFFGFRDGTPISERWRKLSKKKLSELDAMIEQMESMKALLLRIRGCRCHAIEDCGKAVFQNRSANGYYSRKQRALSTQSRAPRRTSR